MSTFEERTWTRVRTHKLGIWEDGNGNLHFDIHEAEAHLGLPPTTTVEEATEILEKLAAAPAHQVHPGVRPSRPQQRSHATARMN